MNLFELNAKTSGAFDSSMVSRRARVAFGQPLAKAAAFIWRRATHSIRRPRRVRLDELSPIRRRIFEESRDQANRDGGPIPILPFASSRPGEPPRSPTGILRSTIFFAVDESSAIIGPVGRSGSGRRVPSVLEFGGESNYRGRNVRIEARPFMRPALTAEIDQLPQLFEGIF